MRALSCALVAGLFGGVPAAARDVSAAAAGMRVARLLTDIRQDARRSWKRQRWDWSAADATGPGAPAPIADDVLLRLLGRRQNAKAGIDAYVRWRLLQHAADLGSAEPDLLAGVLAARPRIVPLPRRARPRATAARRGPRPDFVTLPEALDQARRRRPRGPGRTNPTVSVATTGAVLTANGAVDPTDPRYVTATVEAARADLMALRRVRTFENQAVLRFRDALVEALPPERGVHLLAAMQDAADRIAADEPSHAGSVQRALAAAADPRLRLSAPMRAAMLDFIGKLSALRGPGGAAMAPDQLEVLAARVRGAPRLVDP